jgi:hypothetical protein
MASPMRTISLPSGDQIPVLGQGTWGLGESRARRSSEIAALRRGLDIGMNLVDTAEMYANGDAEVLVDEAIAGRREEVFLVTQGVAAPRDPGGHGAGLPGQPAAAEHGLDRSVPAALARAGAAGRDPRGLLRPAERRPDQELGDQQLRRLGSGRPDVVARQPARRHRPGPLQPAPACAGVRPFPGLPRARHPDHGVLAGRAGRILGNPVLRDIATRLDASPVQVALAWVLRLDNICAIPRSSRPEHVYENRAALAIHLDRDALAALDAEFSPPLHAQPLEVL